MWLVQACRGCLSTEGKLERVNLITWRMFEALTGLQVTETDGYPNMLCTECRWTLKKSIIFRRRCRRAFMALKQIKLEKNIVLVNDIKNVNRKMNNLESSIGPLQPTKTACYNVDVSESMDAKTKNVSMANMATTMTPYEPEIEQSTVHTIDIAPFAEEIILDIDNSIGKYSDDEINNEELLENNELKQTNNLNDVVENFEIDEINVDLNEEMLVEEPDEESTKLKKMEGAIQVIEKEPSLAKENKEIQFYKTKKVYLKNDNESTIQIIKKEQSSTKENNKELRFYKTEKVYLRKLAFALENCNIRALSAEEQLDIMKKRLKEPKFVNATFKCIICVTIFHSIEKLQHHLSLHNKCKGNFDCAVCKYKFTFSVEADLLYHYCTHHKYEFTCNHCTKKIYSSTKLVAHMQKKHDIQKSNFRLSMMRLLKTPEEMYKAPLNKNKNCHICMFSVSKANLNSHLKKHEEPKVGMSDFAKCDICAIWIHKKLIIKHIETHKYKYKCKICNKVYMAKQIAIRHIEKHKESTQCDLCRRKFKTSYWLVKHKIQAHKSFGKFHCSICGSNYNHQYPFYEHQLIEHGYFLLPDATVTDAELHCTECDIQFINDKAYKAHSLLLHPESADKTSFCKFCNKLFDNNEELTNHQKECTYKCPYCPAQMKYGLYHHILKKHPGLPFVHKTEVTICETCGKTVPTNILSHHRKNHEALKMQTPNETQCPYCKLSNALWKNPSTMLLHIAKCHIDKPWQCRLCYRKWQKKEACKEHIMTKHGGYKSNKSVCEICHKLFRNNFNLRRHYRNLHGIAYKTKIENISHERLAKKRGTIAVHPHMQLNLTGMHESLFVPRVLENVVVEVWDYFFNLIGVAPDKFEFLKISKTDESYININEDKMKWRQKIKINIFDKEFNPSATFASLDGVKAEETNMAKRAAKKSKVFAKKSKSINTESNQFPSSSQSESKPPLVQELAKKSKLIETESNQFPGSSQADNQSTFDTPLVKEESESCNAIVIDDDSSIIQGEDGNQYILINGVLYKIDE